MGSLVSIRDTIDNILSPENPSRISRVDILIASAGVLATPNLSPWTSDGFEVNFGINHLGNSLIINKLLPLMISTASLPNSDVRIVILTSRGWKGHPKNGVQYDRLRPAAEYREKNNIPMGGTGTMLRDLTNYGQSKIANLWYAIELARRFGDKGIAAVSVHPGVVRTPMVNNMNRAMSILVKVTNIGRMVSPKEGTRNQLWAAVGAGRDGKTDAREKIWGMLENGAWYMPVGEKQTLGKTGGNNVLSAKLWDWTDQTLKTEGVL
jgi:NAD(P)-dependent dehydrogenase (short-subunit alcohol dehydrogenase family)